MDSGGEDSGAAVDRKRTGPPARRRLSYAIGDRHRSVTFRWILLPTVAVLLVGLVGVFAGPRIYREVRSIRAARLAVSSRQAWEHGDWEAAWRGLQSALTLDRGQPDAARMAAELLGQFGSPASLDHWQVVVRDPSADRADHLAYFDTALRLSRTDVASERLEDLARRFPGDDAVTERRVALALRLGRLAEAAGLSRVALAKDPLNPRWEVLLGESLVRSGSESDRVEGRRILMPIALGSGPHQVTAAEPLVLYGRPGIAGRSALVRALGGRTPVDATVLRLTARLKLMGDPDGENREEILDELLAAGLELQPAGRVLLGEYALEAGSPRVARELVPDTLARAFAPAVTIHLLALAADPGSTGAIRALMTEVGTPLTTAMNTAAGAFLAARQGDRIRSAEGFARAIAAGGRSVDPMRDLTTIGRLAEEVDDRDSAIAAYEALLNRPEAVPVAAAALGRLLPATGDYLRRFHLLSRLHEFMPGSREVACEYGYLALVLGKDVRNVTALFQRFHDLGPEDRTARAGLVLALSVSGKGDAALGLAEGAGFSFEGLGKRERFIYVMSLAAAQQRGAALTLANRIPMESLQPEERALLERHLKILEAPGGRALE